MVSINVYKDLVKIGCFSFPACSLHDITKLNSFKFSLQELFKRFGVKKRSDTEMPYRNAIWNFIKMFHVANVSIFDPMKTLISNFKQIFRLAGLI